MCLWFLVHKAILREWVVRTKQNLTFNLSMVIVIYEERLRVKQRSHVYMFLVHKAILREWVIRTKQNLTLIHKFEADAIYNSILHAGFDPIYK